MSRSLRRRHPPSRRRGLPIAALTLAIAAAAPVLAQTPEARPARPPSADPRDLSGVWLLGGAAYDYQLRPIGGGEAPLTPAAKAIFDRRVASFQAGHNETETPNLCRPHGTPRLMTSPYPIEILQTPGQVTFLHEVAHNVRLIYLDQTHPAGVKPSYLGDSVGHWEGDVLVVDTVAIKADDTTWIDEAGKPHSDALHVVERFRKIDGGKRLEDLITIDDPKDYTTPWTGRVLLEWRPEIKLAEYVCEEGSSPEGGE